MLPLKRFAAYKNLDTDEIGRYKRIPMTVFDHLRQGLFVLLLFFGLAVSVAICSRGVGGDAPVDPTVVAEQELQLESVVEELKSLAQKEAKLVELDKLTPTQEKTLNELRQQRLNLIKDLEKLEQNK